MQPERILVAGIGNIFLGDDAFGSEVARRLLGRKLPDSVRVVDFGIRGFDLAYALMDGYELTVLVDATPRGGEPGTLYTIEPDLGAPGDSDAQEVMVETHGMNPLNVLRLVRSMGGAFGRIILLGCEPAPLDDPVEGRMGLSAPAEAAAREAVALIESLIAEALRGDDMSNDSDGKEIICYET